MFEVDTPVTKKFFRKLELYLELKRQDKRVKKSSRGKMLWEMEKSFLLWALKGHWHLGTPLTPPYVQDRLLEEGFPKEEAQHASQVAQNLVFKKFASPVEGQAYANSIQITDEGFLMAEVIEEAGSKKKYIYIFLSVFIWLTVVLAFLKVVEGIIAFFK